MHIVLCTATRRGIRFLQVLREIASNDRITVFSFPEAAAEPRFIAELQAECKRLHCTFILTPDGRIANTEWDCEFSEVDILFAVSWRYIIPESVYLKMKLGAYVFHDSMLPEYRGFSPTVWSIVNGEDHTGVTLFEMSKKADEGPIIDQKFVPIGPDDTIADVMENVTNAYLAVLRKNFDAIVNHSYIATQQDHSAATNCRRRTIEDNRIDWRMPAQKIYNLVRAVTRPYAGAFTKLRNTRIIIWEAFPIEGANATHTGRVLDIRPGKGAVVSAGDGPILVTKIQQEDEITSADSLLQLGDEFDLFPETPNPE